MYMRYCLACFGAVLHCDAEAAGFGDGGSEVGAREEALGELHGGEEVVEFWGCEGG